MSHTVAITKGHETVIVNLKRVQCIRYWAVPDKEHMILQMNTPELKFEFFGNEAKTLYEEFEKGLTPIRVVLEQDKRKKPERLC